jgi:peptide/nickel transport system substrate-binding protein
VGTSARPKAATLAATLASLVALTACDANARGQNDTDTLRIAGPFEVHSLDPTADGEIFTRLQVSETLVTSDIEGQLTAGLASRWSSSKDHPRWEFDLVQDVT